jgi:hypothetical protein
MTTYRDRYEKLLITPSRARSKSPASDDEVVVDRDQTPQAVQEKLLKRFVEILKRLDSPRSAEAARSADSRRLDAED